MGNRISLAHAATTTAYGYLTGSNRLEQVSADSTVSYGYDNIGNINSKSLDSTVFHWTDDYKLNSVTKNAIEVGAYKYDGNNLRTVKTTSSDTTIFVYARNGKLLAEADKQGKVRREYVYVNDEPLAFFQYQLSPQGSLGLPIKLALFNETIHYIQQSRTPHSLKQPDCAESWELKVLNHRRLHWFKKIKN